MFFFFIVLLRLRRGAQADQRFPSNRRLLKEVDPSAPPLAFGRGSLEAWPTPLRICHLKVVFFIFEECLAPSVLNGVTLTEIRRLELELRIRLSQRLIEC